MLKTVIVCDNCGAAEAETIRVKLDGRTLEKDLCPDDLEAEFESWRRAKRGRPRKGADS